ncbi:unnamed protein product [Prunus armeniaca]|uniref:Uncharacterized protein n=1 Tax=Prunus armeniaca TaxID=36596 RepID=A0A6J5TMJ5_PRUAR|nr:unnamed protein product [Prunus armeniaca]
MSWLPSAIEPTIATSLMFMASAKQQGFPQCKGLISSLGIPRITSTDRYWVYPSAFCNRALNQSPIDRLPVANYSFSSYH